MECKIDSETFHMVKEPSVLLSILRHRLPLSCMIYNQVIRYNHFADVIEFFTVGSSVTNETWILSKNKREDFGTSYLVSAPSNVVDGSDSTAEFVKKCFESGGGVIDWNDMRTMFFLTPWRIATMLTHIMVNVVGNMVTINPGAMYYMDIEQAKNLKTQAPEGVKIRRLDTFKNEERFICDTWAYTAPGTKHVLARDVSRNPSGGAFIDEKCVSGVYIPAVGFVSALFTLKEFRGKGIAKNVMKFAFAEFANEGCIPCLNVESPNKQSARFHAGLGMKIAFQGSSIFLKELKLERSQLEILY